MNSTDEPPSPWSDPEWRGEVLQWITSVCAAHETVVVGDVQPRLRPWSVTLRVPTTGGVVWFKAVTPGAAHEPALLAALAQWTPGSAPHPLGIEPDRGWSLLPDHGRSLADVLGADPDPRHWEEPLRRYAALQRALEDRSDDLLGLGLPDLSPTALPHRLDRLLDDLLARSEMDTGTAAAVDQVRPRFEQWCEELADAGPRCTLDHSDLHEEHVLIENGHYRFYDWGDASYAHPFVSLLVTLRVAGERFHLPPGTRGLASLRDAYLEPSTPSRAYAPGLPATCLSNSQQE